MLQTFYKTQHSGVNNEGLSRATENAWCLIKPRGHFTLIQYSFELIFININCLLSGLI